ncbi:hypothetical protein PR202_gb13116 [Eleusine coracana subsp. coracana]|uniref:DUF3444 domain-containing protein n=1 Tax=Eleusine coracana subsp. coracana TaxID=191504 RepID=A0AAV5ESY9_ELECO|nr:hypothetical protein PR202_gb13116 [Eleusine coracana subsp. coracana]
MRAITLLAAFTAQHPLRSIDRFLAGSYRSRLSCPQCSPASGYRGSLQLGASPSSQPLRKNFFAFKLHEGAFPSRILFSVRNNAQDSSEMISHQELGVASRQVQHNKLCAREGNKDSGPMMHATQSGDHEVSSSEARSEFQFLAMSQTHPHAPSVDKGTTGSVMPDPLDPSSFVTQNLSTKDASMVPNAAGSDDLERLGKRNQDEGVNNRHGRELCDSKWYYDSIIFDANSSDGKLFNDNVSGAENQSVEHHSDISGSQEDVIARPEENQRSYMKEVVGSVTSNGDMCEGSMHDPAGSEIVERQKSVREDASAVPHVMKVQSSAKLSVSGHDDDELRINIADGNVGIIGNSSASCENKGNWKQDVDGMIIFDSDHNKRQRKSDLPSDVDMNCKQIFDDNVVSTDRKSAPVHRSDNVDVEEKGKTTYVDDQGKFLKEAIDSVDKKKPCFSEYLSFQDTDIFDFEKFKDANLFAIGQIWTLYDNLDGMPRLYAGIVHFNPSNLNVYLSWLEPDSANEEEEQWIEKELAVACGNFFLGNTKDVVQDRSMFSHLVSCVKGEIKSCTSDSTTFAFLTKVDGHVAVFMPDKRKTMLEIPRKENLRFSHRILSFCLTEEDGGKLCGFYELDPAAIPNAFLSHSSRCINEKKQPLKHQRTSGSSVKITSPLPPPPGPHHLAVGRERERVAAASPSSRSSVDSTPPPPSRAPLKNTCGAPRSKKPRSLLGRGNMAQSPRGSALDAFLPSVTTMEVPFVRALSSEGRALVSACLDYLRRLANALRGRFRPPPPPPPAARKETPKKNNRPNQRQRAIAKKYGRPRRAAVDAPTQESSTTNAPVAAPTQESSTTNAAAPGLLQVDAPTGAPGPNSNAADANPAHGDDSNVTAGSTANPTADQVEPPAPSAQGTGSNADSNAAAGSITNSSDGKVERPSPSAQGDANRAQGARASSSSSGPPPEGAFNPNDAVQLQEGAQGPSSPGVKVSRSLGVQVGDLTARFSSLSGVSSSTTPYTATQPSVQVRMP